MAKSYGSVVRDTPRGRVAAGSVTPPPEEPASHAQIADALDEQKPGKTGKVVRVFGTDPSKRYNLRYEVRDINELVTSNTDSGAVNPEYPAELQPRDRTRAASRRQVERISTTLVPEAMTAEFLTLDRGAPIIAGDNVVESGNGRTMALRMAASRDSEKWQEYREHLRQVAAERGIDPRELDKVENPVLVRVRVDDVDRVEFAKDANTSAILGYSATETGQGDAGKFSPNDVLSFDVGSSRTIEDQIQRSSNRDVVTNFMKRIPEGERASLMTRSGELTQAGVERIRAGLFSRVYGDDRLSDTIFESTDSDIKTITNSMLNSLGNLGRAEERIKAGQRPQNLSIAGDVAAAVGKYEALKKQGLMSVDEYLAQSTFGDVDITPTQKRLMKFIHENRRSSRKLTDKLNEWADIVESQLPEDNLFGEPPPRRDELIDQWLGSETSSAQASLF